MKKRIFLCQQRRFAKLGKAAAALVDAYPILEMLLNEIQNTNQLSEACQLYLSSEVFKTELQTLAFFYHKILQ